MSGELPVTFWHLFWVGVLAFVVVFSFSMMAVIHRTNAKKLEILEIYAEKGIAPPSALLDQRPSSCSASGQRLRTAPHDALSDAA